MLRQDIRSVYQGRGTSIVPESVKLLIDKNNEDVDKYVSIDRLAVNSLPGILGSDNKPYVCRLDAFTIEFFTLEDEVLIVRIFETISS